MDVTGIAKSHSQTHLWNATSGRHPGLEAPNGDEDTALAEGPPVAPPVVLMGSTRKVPEKGKRLYQKDKQIPAEKGAPSLAVGSVPPHHALCPRGPLPAG